MVTLAVADRVGRGFVSLQALVDTSAAYTRVPASVLQALGHEPDEDRQLVLTDGRTRLYRLGWVPVRLEGRLRPTPVVFGGEGTEPLLGVVTLEEFGLAVDPVGRRLVPVPGLVKAGREGV
jgi:predicted aspartyl protease